MQSVETYTIEDKLLSKNLERIGDLVNIDGPLLSLFMDLRNNELYLFDWADSDQENNRWLIYKVSITILKKFIEKKISYRSLFLSNIQYYYTDINKSNLSTFSINGLKTLPEIYTPTSDIFFDENDAKNLKAINDLILNLPVIERLKSNKEHLVNNIIEFGNGFTELLGIRSFGEPQLHGDLSKLKLKSNIYLSPYFQFKKLDHQNDFKSNRLTEREKLDILHR